MSRTQSKSLTERFKRYGLIFIGIGFVTLHWYFPIELLADLFLILGILIGTYGVIRIISISVRRTKIKDRNDPDNLGENISKYFSSEEFQHLPGFDITFLQPDGITPSNRDLGLVRGHVFDDLLILVVKTDHQTRIEQIVGVIEKSNFGFNMDLTSNPQYLIKNGYRLNNIILEFDHEHNYNLLKDLNELLTELNSNLISS